MMTASRPPPLSVQVLEEFQECSMCDDREIVVESRYVAYAERVRERDRERKAQARAKVLAKLRAIEGIGERACPVCGVVFPVEIGAVGRPQVYCGKRCRWVCAVRAWRERLRKMVGGGES